MTDTPHKIAAAAVAVILLAGLAVGAWLVTDSPADSAAESTELPAVDAAAAFDERLLSLEQLIAEEREARLDLEARLQSLMDDSERSAAAEAAVDADNVRQTEIVREGSFRRSRDFTSMLRNYEERRLNRLTDGGFSEDEARRILQKESEAEYRALQLAWEAERSGEPLDPLATMNDPQAILRAELGDIDYARFLEAQGQPTAVQVTRVLDGSPGSQAGLQPGDEIVSYDGSRIFNVADLRDQTMLGEQGQDVVIEIDRDGVRMQLSVPRGPVGITGSGANIRSMSRWGGG